MEYFPGGDIFNFRDLIDTQLELQGGALALPDRVVSGNEMTNVSPPGAPRLAKFTTSN
jgi:hypothetical protein